MRPVDDAIRARHVQLNSALFIAYYMLHHVTGSAPIPPNADEAKVKVDRANKLFTLKTRQIASLEEAQLIGLAYNVSSQLLQSHTTSGASVDPEDAKVRHSRILERFLRHSVSARSILDSNRSATEAAPAKPSSKSKSPEQILGQVAPYMALLTCQNFGTLFDGLVGCVTSPFVELPPAPSAPAAKASSAASSSSTSTAKATAPAKATGSAKSGSAKAAGTPAPAAKPTAKPTAVTPPGPADSFHHMNLKDKDYAAFIKVIAPPEAESSSIAPEQILAELVSSVAHTASLVTPQTRLFLQSLLWSSHSSVKPNIRDLTTVLEICLRLTGVWTPSLQKLEQCKVSSPTTAALQGLTGVKPSADNCDLRQHFAFGAARSCPWTVSGTVPFTPTSSGFHLHPSNANSLTQVPLSPQLVISPKDSETLFSLQSAHPTDFAARLPWSTVLRYHIRGYGYDGLNMFAENTSNPNISSKVTTPKVELKRASDLLHPLVLLTRASTQDVESFNNRSDECQGAMYFEPSMPRGSSLYRFLFSTFQRFPSDSLAYLLYLESRFDNWMTVSSEQDAVERDILLQKIASLATQSAMQLSHLVGRLLAVSKYETQSQTPVFLRSMIHDTLDVLVVSNYLKVSALVRQSEYRSAITFSTEVLKKISSAQNSIDSAASAPLYPFYSIQFHLLMAKSYTRLRQFDQAREIYQIVLEAEPWNSSALLGLSSLYASDTTFYSQAQSQSTSSTPVYFDIVMSIGYLDMLLSHHPNHLWAKTRKAYLQALPYIHIAEVKQKSAIHAILDQPRETPAAKRQNLWQGTLIQGIGEGIASRTDSADSSIEEATKRSELDGPIIKAGKKVTTTTSDGRKGPKMAIEDDELFETSMHALASNLLLSKSGKRLESPDTGKLVVNEEEEHELMRIAIRSRDALKAAQEAQPDWHWTHYYLGVVELALGNDVDAKEAFNQSKDENPYAKALSAHLLAKAYIQHGTDLDLENSINLFSAALATFGEFKRSEKWIFGTGRGDSAILLEAAIPLSHIWLEQCSQESTDSQDATSVSGTTSYDKAVSLLHAISNAGHKWASFKAATYQLRRGELDNALASILGFIRFFPRHADASILLIEIYRRQGKMAAALKSCQKLLHSELEPSEKGLSSSHPATLYFISTLLHFKANLISTAIAHAKQCIFHIKGIKSSKAQTFPHLELCAIFLLSRMLLSEAIRMSREGRLNDARVALASAQTMATNCSTLAAETKSSPISTFSIQKMTADVYAARLLLLDATTNDEEVNMVSLTAIKAYSYALQEIADDMTNALVRRDLATVHFSKAQLLLNCLSSKASFDAESTAKFVASALQSLDLAVEELKKSVLLLTPPDADKTPSVLRSLASQPRALLLTSWRLLASVSAFYLRTHLAVKADSRITEKVKIPGLQLKHLPSAKTVNHFYTQAISLLVEAPRTSVAKEEESVEVDSGVSELLVTTAAENKESGRLWAEAGLFWMWTQAPLEIVLEALSKAKRFDPSLIDSWVLHALVLLADEKALHSQSNSASFGYRTQSMHTVMAGLLWALEEDESNASSTFASPIELYSSSFDASIVQIDAAEEMKAASGSAAGQREFPSKAVSLRLLLNFALKELSVLPQNPSGDATSALSSAVSAERSSQLEPAVFARRVFALSSRFAQTHTHDSEVSKLSALVAIALGISKEDISVVLSKKPAFALPTPFSALIDSNKDHITWILQRGTQKGANQDFQALVSAYPIVPSDHPLSTASKDAWANAVSNAAQVASAPSSSVLAALSNFSNAIAAVTVNASKSISNTDYLSLATHCKMIMNVVVSVCTAVVQKTSSDAATNKSLLSAITSLLDAVVAGILSMQDLLASGRTESSTLLVNQIQLLFTYATWISTFWRARASWALGDHVNGKDAKSIADLNQLLKDIAAHEATSEEKTHALKSAESKTTEPKTGVARRIVCQPALHGPAQFIVAPASPSLPAFADFLADVLGELLRMLTIAGDGVTASTLWHGLLPFNLKSTQPVLIDLLNASPRDILLQRYPAETSSLEAMLWMRFGAEEMIAVETALSAAHTRAVAAAQAAWLQQNLSRELKEEASTTPSSSQGASPSSSTPSTPARSAAPTPPSEAVTVPPQAIAAQKASASAQRALLLQPWDDRKWKTLASISSLTRPSQ